MIPSNFRPRKRVWSHGQKTAITEPTNARNARSSGTRRPSIPWRVKARTPLALRESGPETSRRRRAPFPDAVRNVNGWRQRGSESHRLRGRRAVLRSSARPKLIAVPLWSPQASHASGGARSRSPSVFPLSGPLYLVQVVCGFCGTVKPVRRWARYEGLPVNRTCKRAAGRACPTSSRRPGRAGLTSPSASGMVTARSGCSDWRLGGPCVARCERYCGASRPTGLRLPIA